MKYKIIECFGWKLYQKADDLNKNLSQQVSDLKTVKQILPE